MKKIEVKENTNKWYTIRGVGVHSPYELYQCQRQFIQYVIRCLQNKANGLVQSPTGTGKTISLLCSTLGWLEHEQRAGRQLHTKIIYASRSHSQLSQAVAQLKLLPFLLKIAVLSGRDVSCINPELTLLSRTDKDLQCRKAIARKGHFVCSYYKGPQPKEIKAPLMDIEELKLRGKAEGFCPFFQTRHEANYSNIIFLPYSYLLNSRNLNREGSINIDGSIVIIDQAHNIIRSAEDARENKISLSSLSRVLNSLSSLQQIKLKQTKPQLFKNNEKRRKTEINNGQLLLCTIEDLQRNAVFVQRFKEYILRMQPKANEESIKLTPSSLLKGVEGEITSVQRIFKLLQGLQRAMKDLDLQPKQALEAWHEFLTLCAEGWHAAEEPLMVQLCYEAADVQLCIHCLDPALSFKDLLKISPHSIILTSGTLTPLNTWTRQLKVPFADPLSCADMLRNDQVNCTILNTGPSGHIINLSYQNRGDTRQYQEIGNALLTIVSHTKNGVLVFFPSYAVLQVARGQWAASTVLSRLHACKEIFYEKKLQNQFKSILQSYLKAAQRERGAILFALVRGKVSQGLDFANEYCRAVVMVGVPYPPVKDSKIIAKMTYLDGVSAKAIQGMKITGKQWYFAETIRAINQSIGRLIRNQHDFGAIYLIDSRFNRTQIVSQISSWAKNVLKVPQSFLLFQQELKNNLFKTNNKVKEQLAFLPNQLALHMRSNKESISGQRKIVKSLKDTIAELKCKKQEIQLKQIGSEKLTGLEIKKPYKQETVKEQKKQIIKDVKSASEFERNIFRPLVQRQECVICRLKKKLIKNSACNHMFCNECWTRSLQKDLRCPLCRVRIREKFLLKE